jgi:hypothetical protein
MNLIAKLALLAEYGTLFVLLLVALFSDYARSLSIRSVGVPGKLANAVPWLLGVLVSSVPVYLVAVGAANGSWMQLAQWVAVIGVAGFGVQAVLVFLEY